MRLKKKSCWLIFSLLVIMLSITINSTTVLGAPDYATALKNSVLFYDANKCGPNVAANNVFSWRSACHTSDGSDKNVNLTGGFHDAGDHVKFGLPQGYAASVMGWALYEFKDVFDSTGNTAKILSTLKYFTDYFLAGHPSPNIFYYQVGDGDIDHAYWGAPENQTGARPTLYWADSSHPASDICGITAGALALMYLNYRSVDSTYAGRCLTAAKELYALGKNYPGYGNGQSFYQSNSFYDDLAWAAMWLYVAEGTSSYLTDIDSHLAKPKKNGENPWSNKWTMCWDDMYLGVFCKMADITGDQKYKDAMNYNLDYWKNSLTRTPAGLRYLHNWGVLRYAASASMLALLYYKQTGDTTLTAFAKSQIDYIFTNPSGMSYMIGFGSSWPQHPHHRAANGYTYANGDNQKPAKYTLTGALVGGPDQSDNYIDDVNQYQYTEVAIDYNAGLVGALAGMIKYQGGSINTPTPTRRVATPTPTRRVVTPTPTRRAATPTPTRRVVTPTPTRRVATPTPTVRQNTPTPTTRIIVDAFIVVSYVIQSDWGNGATINVTITNQTTTPVNGWTLAFTFPGNQTISNLWNGVHTQNGASVSVKDAGFNANIPANGGSVNFGFNINYSGVNAKPTSFTLNGMICQVQ